MQCFSIIIAEIAIPLTIKFWFDQLTFYRLLEIIKIDIFYEITDSAHNLKLIRYVRSIVDLMDLVILKSKLCILIQSHDRCIVWFLKTE